MDYHSGPYGVTFSTGQTWCRLNVTINNDDVLENNETFNLTINSSLLPSNVEVDNPGQAIVTIIDDDSMYIIAHAWMELHNFIVTAGHNSFVKHNYKHRPAIAIATCDALMSILVHVHTCSYEKRGSAILKVHFRGTSSLVVWVSRTSWFYSQMGLFVSCCFLEQGILLTLLQSTQLHYLEKVRQQHCRSGRSSS